MVAFRYRPTDCKILTLVRHCPFRINRLPLELKRTETRSLPHPEHDSQPCVNNYCSCIMCSLGGDWIQTIINEILAVFQCKRESDTLAAPLNGSVPTQTGTQYNILEPLPTPAKVCVSSCFEYEGGLYLILKYLKPITTQMT